MRHSCRACVCDWREPEVPDSVDPRLTECRARIAASSEPVSASLAPSTLEAEMTRAILTLWFLLAVATAGAQAQPRLYIAATTASDTGERGNIPGGAVPSAGALVGLQLSDTWSIELELERGFRTTSAGSGEAVIIAFPPTLNPTREDIELYGIRARSDRRQTAGGGWSAHAVWRSRQPGRVNAGLLMGVSSRVYTSRLARTTTFVSPLLDLPPNYRLPDENSSRHMVAGGLTGGLLIFVRVTRHLTVAPELRMTRGLITDDPYSVFRSGVRAMWSF